MAVTTESITLNAANTTPIIATSELTLEQVTTIISDSSLRSALMGLTVIRNAGQENEQQINWSISANYWDPSNELHIYGTQAGESVSGNAAASFSDSEGSWPTGRKFPKLMAR